MLQIGELLDNKYRILSEVGHGGMSVVYLAINERANKTWAVKEVRKDGVMDFAAVKQGLVVETDMMKKLSHPNLPSIVDVIDTEDSFLIVMDYIEGKSLLKLLKTEGAQPEEEVIRWGRQICDVLGYLHRQTPPVIYRDTKPANIMLKPDGNIALIDFGTAREFKDRAMVEDTICLGTKGYAAPEQFGGRGQTDARTDIYCLGATLYHLLTGHSPAEPPYEIKPISYWIPQYAGSGLEKLILKCTRQDPSRRYQDCAELMYALEHYRDEDDIVRKKRKRRIAAFITALAIGGTALGGALFFKNSEDGTKQASYDSRINTAMMQEDLKAAAPYFRQAMEVEPGAPEAYEKLLEKAGSEIVNNGKLEAKVSDIINQCLTANPSGTSTNIDALAAADPDKYTDVMYEIGLWYFFMKDNGPTDRSIANSSYFSKINNETYTGFLEPEKQEMLKMMSKIGEYIDSIGAENKLSKIGSGTENTYVQLYEDLKKMVSGDLKAKVGNDFYCLAIYQHVASRIHDKYSDFTGAGVTNEQLLELIEILEKGVRSLGVKEGDNVHKEAREAETTIQTARNTVESGMD